MADPLELTPAEQTAKHALIKATEYLCRAQADMFAAQGGMDIGQFGVLVQLLVPQLDALAEVLIDAKLITREAYWTACTQSMQKCEAGLRKTVREMPRIQVAPGNSKPQ